MCGRYELHELWTQYVQWMDINRAEWDIYVRVTAGVRLSGRMRQQSTALRKHCLRLINGVARRY